MPQQVLVISGLHHLGHIGCGVEHPIGGLRPPMVPNSKQGSAEDDWLGWVSPGPAGVSARYETSDSPLAAAIFKASTLRAGVRRAGS